MRWSTGGFTPLPPSWGNFLLEKEFAVIFCWMHSEIYWRDCEVYTPLWTLQNHKLLPMTGACNRSLQHRPWKELSSMSFNAIPYLVILWLQSSLWTYHCIQPYPCALKCIHLYWRVSKGIQGHLKHLDSSNCIRARQTASKFPQVLASAEFGKATCFAIFDRWEKQLLQREKKKHRN